MKKENLIKTIQGYDHRDLLKEQYGKHNLSVEEVIMLDGEIKPLLQNLTIKEFANAFEGNTLSILYKDNKQVGFIRLTSTDKHSLFPLRTIQNIVFDVDHPENGLIIFDLNEYRDN